MMARLSDHRQIAAGELAATFPEGRRPIIQCGLLFLAKYDLATILPQAREISG